MKDGGIARRRDIPLLQTGEEEGQACLTDGTPSRSHKWARDADLLEDGVRSNLIKVISNGALLSLAYKSIGVVYGDIGTSPLYVYSSIFSTPPSREDLMGALCLIFWTLTLIPLVKYVFIVLRMDDNGEGGTFALYSLLCRHANISLLGSPHAGGLGPSYQHSASTGSLTSLTSPLSGRRATAAAEATSGYLCSLLERSRTLQALLLIITLTGTCMVIGDGVLTPAISVLSAVQGIGVAGPKLSTDMVVFITCIILVGLFTLQHLGTAKVGTSFAPIVLTWFVLNATIGFFNLVKYDISMLGALLPHHGVTFFIRNGHSGFVALGGVVLAITGSEAMAADLAHFSQRAIQLAFGLLGYPCLVLTYLGQAAYLSAHPEHVSETFYKSLPATLYWPMFGVATAASVVASQAMISGAFSIIKQSMALSCFPNVRVLHTSEDVHGQIYIPQVNNLFMVLTLGVVIGFKDGAAIGNAYGVAVVFVMLITTFLSTLVMIVVWKTPLYLALPYFAFFTALDSTYLSSTLFKVENGGWFPLMFAGALLFVMFTWHYGSSRKTMYDEEHKVSIDYLRTEVADRAIHRVPGIGLFYSENVTGVPPVFQHFLHNLPSVPQLLLFLTIRHEPVPYVAPDDRLLINPVGVGGVYRCVVRYGYKENIDQGAEFANSLVLQLLDLVEEEAVGATSGVLSPKVVPSVEEEVRRIEEAKGCRLIYVLGKISVQAKPGSWWGKQVLLEGYRGLKAISHSITDTYRIPHSQLMLVGMIYDV